MSVGQLLVLPGIMAVLWITAIMKGMYSGRNLRSPPLKKRNGRVKRGMREEASLRHLSFQCLTLESRWLRNPYLTWMLVSYPQGDASMTGKRDPQGDARMTR